MKGRFQSSSGGGSEASLTLTPLLDMFTIILIFLIVSFQAEDHGFEPNKDVKLPSSSSRSTFKPAVNLALSQEQLLLEKEPLMSLDEGRFDEKYYEAETIKPLVEELKKYYDRIKKGKGKTKYGTDDPILLVQADKRHNYETLYLVLKSAAVAGFVKYRLVTMKE